jgi:hypothetical protein
MALIIIGGLVIAAILVWGIATTISWIREDREFERQHGSAPWGFNF